MMRLAVMPAVASAMATACLCLPAAALSQQVCDDRSHALSSPTTGFEDHGDGTVTDRRSGLMWMRCSAGQQWVAGTCSGEAAGRSWAGAREAADEVNRHGSGFFNDWRLPRVQELASIAERECRNPRINLALFPNTPADYYWTASSRRAETPDVAAFALSFGADGIERDDKGAVHFVRFVRNAR